MPEVPKQQMSKMKQGASTDRQLHQGVEAGERFHLLRLLTNALKHEM